MNAGIIGAGPIVIDTTNQFTAGGLAQFSGATAAQHNAARMPGARDTKNSNTLTAGFRASAAGRRGPDQMVQWLCGDDADVKAVVMGLTDNAGYFPADLSGTATCSVMEAPRRPGAVYGQEYRPAEAAGQPIPDTPRY
jgi:predicted dinucleotide-binding enzyme